MGATRRTRCIRAAVSAITATLLGPAAGTAAESNTVDSSLLLYSETGRVTAAEGVFHVGRTLNEHRSVGLRMVFDALTGASPNGATPSSRIQTFTGPSGGSSYVIQPGELPLDSTFSDQRIALDASLRESLNRITFLDVGGHFSYEHDYTSLGLNAGISREFNRRNTTLGLSTAYSHDIVRPLGGAPVPLASMPPPSNEGGEGEEGEGDESGPWEGKDLFDVLVGATQVLGRNTLVRLDYSMNHATGYLNDPYKLLSVVQDRTASAPGEPLDYVFESRPGSRTKQVLFGQLRRYLSGSALDLSYRYFWDDWGIQSHTMDVFFNVPLRKGHSIEPHFRWYRQTEADFHAFYLVGGQPLPQHASADSRLAAFDAYTYGLQYTLPLNLESQLRVTGEYYSQKASRGPPDPIGILAQYDLFPPLDVFMVRVGYAREF